MKNISQDSWCPDEHLTGAPPKYKHSVPAASTGLVSSGGIGSECVKFKQTPYLGLCYLRGLGPN
jgi:hypothetical protein